VPDSSFSEAGQRLYSHTPSTLRTAAFPPSTVMQGWNHHAYGISATVSVSGSPRSDIKAMSVDEAVNSRPPQKTSSKMSVDYSPLTSTRRKASSGMSVDPSSPNAYQSRASSRMSVDIPSTRLSRGSSDRMLLDEIQYDYPRQNLPQQAHSYAPSTTWPAATSTTVYHSASPYASREHALASGVASSTTLPVTVPETRTRPLLYDTRSPRARGEAKLVSKPSSAPPSSFLQHTQGKNHKTILPVTSTPPNPCTSPLFASAPVLPSSRTPAAPPKTVSQNHEAPPSMQRNTSSSTKQEIVHSPTRKGHVRARGSSSGDEVSHKRHCVRQDSQPMALFATDPRSACSPSARPTQSLSPIDEVPWLPPMEQQLETARQSQLKAKFRKFKAIIGGAVNEIKQAIVPYNKDHRKHKFARMRSDSRPFAGVPDYLRSSERSNLAKLASASRYHKRAPFDIKKDINSIAETWTNLTLCDSPTSLHGNDVAIHGEVPHLSLPPPTINEPSTSPCNSRPARRTTSGGSVAQIRSDDEVEIYIGTAAALPAPTFRRQRTADAFDARGMVVPRPPSNNGPHRKSGRSPKK
jgi:hypothetical protein